jgi:hypothetical protein
MGVTVVLAVLVCIVAGLLLATGFYRDFWIFWFCFVVATAHFSLVKSVQGDPASPIPVISFLNTAHHRNGHNLANEASLTSRCNAGLF